MKQPFLVWCFCTVLLLMIWYGFSQSAVSVDRARYWYAEAERKYHADAPSAVSDSLALVQYELAVSGWMQQVPAETSIGDALIKRGNILQGQRRWKEAAGEYHRTLFWFGKHGKDSVHYYQAQLHLGSVFYYSYKIDSARYYLEAAADLALNRPGFPDLDVLYNSLGALYFQSSNYLQASNYFVKARLLLNPSGDDYQETYNGFSNNIAICLAALGQHDQALAIYLPLLKDPYLKNRVRQNIGHLYFEKGNRDVALYWFEQVLPERNSATVRRYQEMARIYLEKKQWDQVDLLLDSADRLNRSIGESPKEKAAGLLLRSKKSVAKSAYTDALQWVDEAIRAVNENNAPLLLFESQEWKAGILQQLHVKTGQLSYLADAVEQYLQAIKTAGFIRSNYDNDDAKLFFNNHRRSVFLKAADAVYNWYQLSGEPVAFEAFFQVEEHYKGTVLSDQLKFSQQKEGLAAQNRPLLKREQELRQAMAYYSSLLNTLTDSAAKAGVETEMVSTRVALSRIHSTLDNELVSNAQAVGDELPSLFYLQQQILPDQAVISFIQGEKHLFRLVVTDKTTRLDRIELDSVLSNSIQAFVAALHSREPGVRYKGHSPGWILYEALLKPLEKELEAKAKWTMLNDGYLHLVPYEALPVDPIKHRFLLEEKTIHYQSSFTLIARGTKPMIGTLPPDGWMSFAPYYQPDPQVQATGLAVLPSSAAEAGDGTETLLIKGPEATKKRFLAEAGNSTILHIASHAAANSEDLSSAWVKFYPAQPDSTLGHTLFLSEIYPLALQKTELVILSACESANGIASAGEGLLSMARAFLYAGSKGVIASMWQSEDQVTAYLIRNFRTELQSGQPVETALQRAKRQFLDDPSIPIQLKQPNYWAHLVYMGNCSAEEGPRNWLLIAVFVMVFMIVMGSYYFRTNASSSDN